MPHVELPQAEFKIVMLGDSHTGKTSLVLRFVEGSYREERPPTVGAFFITKRLQAQGITCKLQLWDTAGQAQFRPLAKMYYDCAAAAILCFDVQSHSSWQVTKFWLEELHRNVPAGSIVLCLCACQVDAPHHVVSTTEAKELAAANGAMFVETSAKQNFNVQGLFQKVAERVLHFQRKNRETSMSKIPVTPGAAVDQRGQVVKSQYNNSSNTQRRNSNKNSSNSVNRYGVALVPNNESDGIVERDANTRMEQHPATPTTYDSKTTSTPNTPATMDASASVESRRRRGKRIRSKPDEIMPEPGMCGVLPGRGDECVIL